MVQTDDRRRRATDPDLAVRARSRRREHRGGAHVSRRRYRAPRHHHRRGVLSGVHDSTGDKRPRASRPPNSVVHQPSATIFNATMVLSGALVLVATYFVHRTFGRRVVSVPLALFGVGVLGVGVFPGNRVPWHGIFALLTFVSGGVTVVLSSRVVTSPFRYLCLAFGGVSLTALASAIFLGSANPLLVLGLGGVERWVVYPLLLWMTGFGGYLMGHADRGRESSARR
ncbi:DUF998 domain-containing protein [Halorussus caseinilyticus]